MEEKLQIFLIVMIAIKLKKYKKTFIRLLCKLKVRKVYKIHSTDTFQGS